MSRRDLASEESAFPLLGLDTAAAHLRRPFMPGAVKWKVEKVGGGKGMVIGYIDARLVIERLNLVVPGQWYETFTREGGDGKHLWCHLTVCGITHADVGTGNDLKSMVSDARKRSAVPHGIGVSLYAMRAAWYPAMREPKKPDQLLDTGRKSKNGNPIYEIPPNTETYLRQKYEAWLGLEDRGGVFGPPLNHGDDPEGSVGEAADAGVEPEQTALDYTDPKEAEEQIKRIREVWESVDKRKLPKSRLDAMLAGANGDGDLSTIYEHVAGLAEVSE